jgi:HD-GYP domain-containing protein (c-di-GMP phosphodiesterase class II)
MSSSAELKPDRYERWVDETALDDIAQAFADIIDAKSPFTFRHSSNVAQYACGIARQMGFARDEQHRLLRAGLLHDIGKVGVSNQILDKNGPLTARERGDVERHPAFTWQILSRVEAFRTFAWTASVHHEKLDGSGYPWRLTARDLDLPARILGVADVYEALTADRPYRRGLSSGAALEIMLRDRGRRLCETTLDALHAYVTENVVPFEL